MAQELYANLASTAVGVGGYTAGSGVLNVTSTGAPFPAIGAGQQFHVLIFRVITGVNTPIVVLKVTAINSGTQWAVTAEGTDTNALAGDTVVGVLSSSGMDTIRLNSSGVGLFANRPSPSLSKAGDTYQATDGSMPFWSVFDGTNWNVFAGGYAVTPPDDSTFIWVNQQTATISVNGSQVSIQVPQLAGDNLCCRITPIPHAAPWTATMLLAVTIPNAADAGAGIIVRDSVSGNMRAIQMDVNAGGFRGMQGSVTGWGSLGTNQGQIAGVAFMKAENDGTNINFYLSYDNINFRLILSQAVAGFPNVPDQVGFFVQSENAPASVLATLLSYVPA